jgi:hypothetical protein
MSALAHKISRLADLYLGASIYFLKLVFLKTQVLS